jgi:5-formyltetrahydrofolate cyclo-ligase
LLWFESNGSHRHRRVTPSDSTRDAARRALRARLAARRRSLTRGERAHAAHEVAHHALRSLPLRAGSRVAIYASLPAELDTAPLIELARARGCLLYLPRIERPRSARGMRFLALDGRLTRNRLGINEPHPAAARIGARGLDLVLLPLVGFDRRGVRLGTGGGFYDRAFAFRNHRSAWHAPRLVGLAYAFQELEHIESAAHDVRMDAVITDEGVIRCSTG